jgi:hypothetical protein
MTLTLIGTLFVDGIEGIFADLDLLKYVNSINSGMFGNFKTLMYTMDIPDSEIVRTRKTLLECVKERIPLATCLCEYGNWNRIVLLFPRKIQVV